MILPDLRAVLENQAKWLRWGSRACYVAALLWFLVYLIAPLSWNSFAYVLFGVWLLVVGKAAHHTSKLLITLRYVFYVPKKEVPDDRRPPNQP